MVDTLTNMKTLFGAWMENGDEDKQLDEIFRSRQIPIESRENSDLDLQQ